MYVAGRARGRTSLARNALISECWCQVLCSSGVLTVLGHGIKRKILANLPLTVESRKVRINISVSLLGVLGAAWVDRTEYLGPQFNVLKKLHTDTVLRRSQQGRRL